MARRALSPQAFVEIFDTIIYIYIRNSCKDSLHLARERGLIVQRPNCIPYHPASLSLLFHVKSLWLASAPKIFLAMTRILHSVPYTFRTALDPIPQSLYCVTEGLARTPSHAGDCLPHPATGSAHDSAGDFGNSAHPVADGGGHEGDRVLVLVVVERHGAQWLV